MVKQEDEEVKPKVTTQVKAQAGSSGGAPAAEVSEELLKATITTIISEGSLEELSNKKIRRIAEQKLQLETNALDGRKELLTKLTDEVMSSKRSEEAPVEPQAKAEQEEEEEQEEQEEQAPKKKGKKRAAAAGEEGGPPKKLKELQSKMMTASEFERTAPQLSALLFGEHNLEGAPRTFTSGNRGWYAGGKMQIDVGKKKLWVQVGLNVTIVGSKEWED